MTFGVIAGTLFFAELTDKDALLLLTLATKKRARTVFFAGSTAFMLTSVVNVALGAVVGAYVDLNLVKLAGGAVMFAYGLWELRKFIGEKTIEDEEKKLEKTGEGWKPFFAMVGALALLDLAGDATMVLTVVFMARYSDALLVFGAAVSGLVAATAIETALGNRVGSMLTPKRIRYVSVVVFLGLGSLILSGLI